MIKAKLDASKVVKSYGSALRRLSQLTGFDQRAVLLGEAGIILKTWAGRTKVATQAKTDQRSWRHILNKAGLDVTGSGGTKVGDITVNAGIRGPFGRVWVRTRSGKSGQYGGPGRFRLAGVISEHGQSFRPMNYHWKNATWTDIQELVEDVAIQARKKIPAGRRAAGLARQSVIQIADALNIDLERVKGGGTLSAQGIAKARAALATNGQRYDNGKGFVSGNEVKSAVTLINNLPYGTNAGMDRTLLYILNGRQKYFEASYANGAFQTVKGIAKAYPWMRVSAPTLN